MYPIFPDIHVSPSFEEKFYEIPVPDLTEEEFEFFDGWMKTFHPNELETLITGMVDHITLDINMSDDDSSIEYVYLSLFVISPEILLRYIEAYATRIDLDFSVRKLDIPDKDNRYCFLYRVELR